MVIKDIKRPEQNFELLIKEQIIDNKKFQISYAKAPIIDNSIKISVSIINESGVTYYEEVMNAFSTLINSGLSEFTSKALKVFNKVKGYSNKIGSGKNAI